MSFDVFNSMISKTIGESDIIPSRHIAIVGSSGAGKTTWSCRAKNCLVLLTESQAEGRVGDTNRDARVVVITRDQGIPEYDNLSDFQKMTHCIKWITRDLLSENSEWVPSVIVVDSFTELFRMVADEVGESGNKSWTFETWKKYSDMCVRLVRKFRDMGPMLIGTFLDESADGGDGQVPIRRMSLGTKKLPGVVAAMFDMVFWAEVKERQNGDVVHALRTVGGFYNGQRLEQGKGHPALDKWLDPSIETPDMVVEKIAKWREEGQLSGKPKKEKKNGKQKKSKVIPQPEDVL